MLTYACFVHCTWYRYRHWIYWEWYQSKKGVQLRSWMQGRCVIGLWRISSEESKNWILQSFSGMILNSNFEQTFWGLIKVFGKDYSQMLWSKWLFWPLVHVLLYLLEALRIVIISIFAILYGPFCKIWRNLLSCNMTFMIGANL